MNKPQNKLFDVFSQFLEDKVNFAKEELEAIATKQQKSWFGPKQNEQSSSLEPEQIAKKFDRKELQNAYVEHLKKATVPIEATTLKMQNSFIQAAEQAYRIRHNSLPRNLATGYMDLTRWSEGGIKFLLIERIRSLGEIAMADYQSKIKEN